MNTFLCAALLLCGLVAGDKTSCSSVCFSECKTLRANCEDDTAVILYNAKCDSFETSCQNMCSKTFCPCLADAENSCGRNNNLCKGKDGRVDYVNILKVAACVAPKSAACFAKVIKVSTAQFLSDVKAHLSN